MPVAASTVVLIPGLACDAELLAPQAVNPATVRTPSSTAVTVGRARRRAPIPCETLPADTVPPETIIASFPLSAPDGRRDRGAV